jgi:7-cyano-7-deazaguanine synthase in queuosine biosynthesis
MSRLDFQRIGFVPDFGGMKTMHVISVSGGKDSTALLLLALDRCPRESVIPIFFDTGNEHAIVQVFFQVCLST